MKKGCWGAVKGYRRAWILLALCVSLVWAGAGLAEQAIVTVTLPEETVAAPAGGLTNDQAAEGYIRLLMSGGEKDPALLEGNTAGDLLTGQEKNLYEILRKKIGQVAAGTLESTVFSIPLKDVYEDLRCRPKDLGVEYILDNAGNWNEDALTAFQARLAIDAQKISSSLLYDLPYEMYWYDKTSGSSYGGPSISAGTDNEGQYICIGDYESGSFECKFYVSKDYSASGNAGTFDVNQSFGTRARTAAANARQVVADNAGLGDEAKLTAYKEYICGQVDYNYAAARNNSTPYGDPWQLVYVFDGDSETKVVCEGYSKAFQFLCDESTFTGNISVISVSGYMDGGAHMWNIVTRDDGFHYMADVTNSDQGSVGAHGGLFLSEYFRRLSDKTYMYQTADGDVTYTYNQNTIDLLNSTGLLAMKTSREELAAPTVTIEEFNKEDGTSRIRGLPGTPVTDGTSVMWYLLIEKKNETGTTSEMRTLSSTETDGSFSLELSGWEEGDTIVCSATYKIGENYSEPASVTVASINFSGYTHHHISLWEQGPLYLPLEGYDGFSNTLPLFLHMEDESSINRVSIEWIEGDENLKELLYVVNSQPWYMRMNRSAGTGQATFRLTAVSNTGIAAETFTLTVEEFPEETMPALERETVKAAAGQEVNLSSLGIVYNPNEYKETYMKSDYEDERYTIAYDGTFLAEEAGTYPGRVQVNLDDYSFRTFLFNVEVSDIRWEYEDGVLTISGTGPMEDYEEEAAPWSSHENDIRELVVENGVTSVGEYAFADYPALEKVTLAGSVKTIGMSAFQYCGALKDVSLPEELTTVENAAFNGCRSLKSVTLPSSLKTIGFISFAECGLTRVNASGDTTTWHLFYCDDSGDRLYHIDLPSGVEKVEEGAFCSNPLAWDVPDLVMPNDLTTIEAEALSGIDGEYVWLSENTVSVGDLAFANSHVRYVYIPYACTEIGDGAFPAGTVILCGINTQFEPGYAKTWAENNGCIPVVLEAPFSGNG